VELARASALPPGQVARDLGIDPDTLRRWLRQADVAAGRFQGTTTDEQAELVRLRRAAARLREERDSLQQATASCARARTTMNTFRCIAAQAAQHAVRLLCRVLGVSRSGSCAWRTRPAAARVRADQALTAQLRQISAHSRQTDGSPRVRATLCERGEMVGRRRVARLMRRAGLRGVHGQRRRVRTTVADPRVTPAPDRVKRSCAPAAIGAPDRLWLADSSSIPTREGWRYLAIILDGFSRRVVGWAMADHRQTALVLAALRPALHRRRPAAGRIHHSDRGCRYTSLACGQHLLAAGLVPSTGSGGDCDDNAVAESFFASLKVALVDRHDWPSRAAARVAIVEYIEVWYHRQRLHSTLGYLSTAQFETRAHAGITA
jgi:putative transposase